METVQLVLVSIIVCSALYTDLASRRIPNLLTLGGMTVGLLLNAYSGWDLFLSGLGGALIGIALLFIPFALGGIGGGDVKLLACIGAFMGPAFVLYTALYMALAGGIVAVFILVKQRLLVPVFFRLVTEWKLGLLMKRRDEEEDTLRSASFPYAVAITAGFIATVVFT